MKNVNEMTDSILDMEDKITPVLWGYKSTASYISNLEPEKGLYVLVLDQLARLNDMRKWDRFAKIPNDWSPDSSHIVFVYYTDDVSNVSATELKNIRAAVDRKDIALYTVADELIISKNRYRSLMCDNEECCPLEGNLI